jgi:hypothetical protein
MATCVLVITPDVSQSYQKVCEEFIKAQRTGMCNISDTVQMYLIPPIFQSQITVLKDIRLEHFPKRGDQFIHQILLGIIVVKEHGPAHLVNRHYPTLPIGKKYDY